ncbi:MAG: cyclic-phosphate processing receiver domain-containing protein [Isosphaeraceae bacterium]
MSFLRLFRRENSASAPPAGSPHALDELSATSLRRLFLDDDPLRAQIFLKDFPDAVWVSTVPECLEKLAEAWDEVHLDHDLGGEHFVDLARPDCGMEVVRWLCLQPRPHLSSTRFYVHSHNPNAAAMMGMQMISNGYFVELRPFGAPPLPPLPEEEPPPLPGRLGSVLGWVRGLFRREPQSFGYGYTEYRNEGPPADESLPRFDLSWTRPTGSKRKGPSDRTPPSEPPTA